jgi:transcriptional regulator with GAF, ATPase, and Fis domain
MPYLQYQGPDGQVVRYEIHRKLTTIGSAPDCNLVLNGLEVADTHCTLTHEPGRYVVESTSRSNPFFLRGKKTRNHDLSHGDVLVIGGIEISFSAVDAPTEKKSDDEASDLQLSAMLRLQEFSAHLLESRDLDGLLDELIDQVVGLTKASKGFLVLSGDDTSAYEIRVARNLERQPVDDPAQLLSDDIIREVITNREAQIISDAYNDKRFQNSMSVINLKLSSVMCAPLIVRGELLGLIYVGNNDVVALFTADQLEMLKVFASQAALLIKNAIVLNELRDESKELGEKLEQFKFGSIIGGCPAMIEVYNRVEKVAHTDITVLITGETGTGKELIAGEIHTRSPRKGGPFVTVNCGAIPENLIESELFGHVKGAFTGAVRDQVGKFLAADRGTLFLDEIGELPLAMQVKLLRAIQEKQIQRVGDSKTTPVDIRIVAATNRNLKQEVAEGRFREDLFFRLNVIGIELPPLRERGDDVVLIARYLVERYASEYGRDWKGKNALDDGAERALMKFGWPGNIRQLENHLRKAIVLAEGDQITARDMDLELPDTGGEPEAIATLSDARDSWQRGYINKVLALNNGNRTKTARDLGVDPRTIFRHLEKEEKEKDKAKLDS